MTLSLLPAETGIPGRAAWQTVLFAPQPRRLALTPLTADWPLRSFHLLVVRNQPFEYVAGVLPPFLAYGGWRAEVSYSAYDDSLQGAVDASADVVVVWLDYERYRERLTGAELIAWLKERFAELRRQTMAPLLIANWPARDETAAGVNQTLDQFAAHTAGVRICDLRPIADTLGDRYRDARAARMTGTTMSDAACLLTGRLFGCIWLPAVLAPRLKAIAVDLDNTLYAGVLGEDGLEGVRLTAEHAQLHRALLDLRDQGVFLALVSRNEVEDVAQLFARRTDFPLRMEHFSATAIMWQSKTLSLRQTAAALRIGLDALLFVDDNPGELAAVAAELPEVHWLHAASAVETFQALQYYPGLHGFPTAETDRLRVADLAAASERARLNAVAADPKEYLRSLEVELTFAMNPASRQRRLHELSVKTNQFNTGLLRLSEIAVAQRLSDPACRTVSIGLADKLSDSGTVGVLFARRAADALLVEEICVSCRALGRRLEDAMITEALRAILAELPAKEICFAFTEGPRNRPAREWLAAYTANEPTDGPTHIDWRSDHAASILNEVPVRIRWETV